MNTKYPILVVDDEVEMRIALKVALERCKLPVELSHNAKDAIAKIKEHKYSLVLSDMTMPKKSGVELLKEIKEFDADLPVIIMTAHGTIETAVASMKFGAFDYILKPFDFDTVIFLIERALSSVSENNRSIKKTLPTAANKEIDYDKNDRSDYKEIITVSQNMLDLLQLARSVAKGKSTIFIEAESGTGKELLSRYIHDNSDRKDKPFIAVNCAALPESLLESELFGHKKGSFTGAINDHKGKFEQAQGGTILLDEITEMSLSLQSKLLRVLQEFTIDRIGGYESVPIDVRVIATSNRKVFKYVEEGKFREDLFFRLNVIPLSLPPLRERPDDIESLASHFIKKHAKINSLTELKFSREALNILKNYHWRGNVRELENVVERSILLAQGSSEIQAKHLLLLENNNKVSKNSAKLASLNSDSLESNLNDEITTISQDKKQTKAAAKSKRA